MNRIVILVFICFVSTYNLVYSQSKCLKEIKEGTFYSFSTVDTVVIVRGKDYQTEIFNNGNSLIKSNVTWKSENEFFLQILEIENVDLELVEICDVINIIIKSCTQDYYDFYIKINDSIYGPERNYR